MLKVALIEAGHWHAPLYLDGLSAAGVQVTAVCDGRDGPGRDLANQLDARFYDSCAVLLEAETVDFAFVFGRPADMPRLAGLMLDAGIPFALEKPCGIDVGSVVRLRDRAAAAGAFVAVPFVYRVGGLREAFAESEGCLPGDFKHMSFRFIGGPPERYVTAACPWMLDPVVAGGGSTINLAGHFVDLFRLLTGQEVETVRAVMHNGVHGEAIEDYSVMTLKGERGTIAVIETGYGFPSTCEAPREFSFTIRSRDNYYRSTADGIELRDCTNPSEDVREGAVELNNDHYYGLFVRDTLERFARGAPPCCGLDEAVAVMKVIQAAYRSARDDGRPVAAQ